MTQERIEELEQKAIKIYIGICDWEYIIGMLSEEEEEYYKLINGDEE